MMITDAIALLKANGYRVTKSKLRRQARAPGLNAIGKPYSPQFDPNYRMQHKPPNITRLLKPMPANTPWVKC